MTITHDLYYPYVQNDTYTLWWRLCNIIVVFRNKEFVQEEWKEI